MSGFGFAFPAGAALAALAVPLVLLYVLKLRRRPHAVSSTYLWRRVVEDRRANALWEGLRRHLLLLLQLLVLALLAIAFAGPFRRTDALLAGETLIVLDASASMGARLPGQERTRFDAARAAVEELVAGLDASRRAALVIAAPEPRVAAALTGDAAALRRALEGARPTEAPADLAAALELARTLARGRPDAEVVLATDGAADSTPSLEAALSGVRVLPLDLGGGASNENAGLVAVALRPAPGALDEQEVFATVASFGERDRVVTLVLESASPPASVEAPPDPRSWPWAEAAREELVLAPSESRARLFAVTASPGTALRLRLASDRPDLLAADDEALLVVPPRDRVRALVVSEEPTLLSRALAAQQGVEVYEAAGLPANASDHDVVVLDGPLPALLPAAPLLAFGPPSAGGERLDAPQLARWDRRHPALRHADLAPVQVLAAWRAPAPPGAQALVETDAGPIAWAWEAPGGPALWMTFGLTDSDLPLRVAFPVLVADAVEWLTGRGGDDGVAPTGRPRDLRVAAGASSARLVLQDGAARDLIVRAGSARVPPSSRCGVVRLELPGSAPRLLASALLSPPESDLSPRLGGGGTAAPAAGAAAPRREPGRRPLWPLVVSLALVALLGEWAVHHRRRG